MYASFFEGTIPKRENGFEPKLCRRYKSICEKKRNRKSGVLPDFLLVMAEEPICFFDWRIRSGRLFFVSD